MRAAEGGARTGAGDPAAGQVVVRGDGSVRAVSSVVAGRHPTQVVGGFSPGAAVVTVDGPLTGSVLRVLRGVVDRLLRSRPGDVVLDLTCAHPEGDAALVVSVLRHHLSRHGVRLWIAGCSPALMPDIKALDPAGGQRFTATPAEAVSAAQALARLSRPRSPADASTA